VLFVTLIDQLPDKLMICPDTTAEKATARKIKTTFFI
jgi:hypothetical protein